MNQCLVLPGAAKNMYHPDNSSRVSAVEPTQAEANDIARRIAQNEKVNRITQGRDGRIVSHDSYDNDPCPPKDKEH